MILPWKPVCKPAQPLPGMSRTGQGCSNKSCWDAGKVDVSAVNRVVGLRGDSTSPTTRRPGSVHCPARAGSFGLLHHLSFDGAWSGDLLRDISRHTDWKLGSPPPGIQGCPSHALAVLSGMFEEDAILPSDKHWSIRLPLVVLQGAPSRGHCGQKTCNVQLCRPRHSLTMPSKAAVESSTEQGKGVDQHTWSVLSQHCWLEKVMSTFQLSYFRHPLYCPCGLCASAVTFAICSPTCVSKTSTV